MTTVVSFLPVFALTAAEGKLFRPVAFTKSFAIVAALLVSMLALPALAHLVLRTPCARRNRRPRSPSVRWLARWSLPRHRARRRAPADPKLASSRTRSPFRHQPVVRGHRDRRTCYWRSLAFQRVYVPILRWSLRHKALACSLFRWWCFSPAWPRGRASAASSCPRSTRGRFCTCPRRCRTRRSGRRSTCCTRWTRRFRRSPKSNERSASWVARRARSTQLPSRCSKPW